jgi:hypothetical protein
MHSFSHFTFFLISIGLMTVQSNYGNSMPQHGREPLPSSFRAGGVVPLEGLPMPPPDPAQMPSTSALTSSPLKFLVTDTPELAGGFPEPRCHHTIVVQESYLWMSPMHMFFFVGSSLAYTTRNVQYHSHDVWRNAICWVSQAYGSPCSAVSFLSRPPMQAARYAEDVVTH